MGFALPKERRFNRRLRLTGLLPGKLTSVKNDRNVSAKPLDISETGLGLLIAEEFEPGHRLKLTSSKWQLQFEIVWVKPDFGKRNLFRYGLSLVEDDKGHDVVQIFSDAGCLR